MNTIIFETEFTFNEVEFFGNLVAKDGMNIRVLDDMNLEDQDFKFVYQKDSQGSWYRFCYKGNERIHSDDVEPWMREYVWKFEKENSIYQ